MNTPIRNLLPSLKILFLLWIHVTALVNPFLGSGKKAANSKPKLVLIGGCPGTVRSDDYQ